MEFVPPVSNPAFPRLQVPWFGSKDKTYKAAGLDSWLFYPHNEGYNIQHIADGDFHGNSWEDTAGFVQRWAYWGMIEEILTIGGLEGFSVSNGSTDLLRSFSSSLPYLLMLWDCVHYDSKSPDASEIELERFFKITVILKRVNNFYTLFCHREFAMQEKPDDIKSPNKAQFMYGPHSHKHEEPSDWDDWAGKTLGGRPSFFTNEPRWPQNAQPLESAGHALLLSIGVAGELLSRAVERKYKRKIENLKWAIPLTITRRLQLAGWCPTWLRKLRDEGSIIRAYYLSSIKRVPVDKHARCCIFGCIASQVKASTYKVKHTSENCECQMVSFDLGDGSECSSWIKAGHTPLIVRVRDTADGSTKWKLISSHDVLDGSLKKYVAMSHVWVDGTGSVDGNSLLRCQLNKFQNAAIRLYGGDSSTDEPVPFWVDTVCVPFNGHLKMTAIRQMEQVYRDADKVLVFDSGLQRVTLDMPASECLTQVEISSWNERLWTIQEAVFAKSLHFQFQDGISSLRDLIFRYRLERFGRIAKVRREMNPAASSEINRMLCWVLDMHLKPVTREGEDLFENPPGVQDGKDWVALDADGLKGSPSDMEIDGLQVDTIFLGTVVAVSSFFGTLQEPASGSEQARVKWSSLEKVLPYKQTSVVSDEGLCLATLLGMDLTELYNQDDKERIRRMFLHIGTVGEGILFGTRPRLQEPGYRWMPSSFVNQRIEPSERVARITEAGVESNLPGLKITFPPKGFLMERHPHSNSPGKFGFAKLGDDDEDGSGYLIAGSFPICLVETDQLYTVYLVLPDGFPGITAPPSGLTLLLEEELIQPPLNPALARSAVHIVLQEWTQLRKKSVIDAILLDPAASGPLGTASYKLSAVVVEWEDSTPNQRAAAAQAIPLKRRKWVIS